MYIERTFYGIQCDRCREDYEGNEYSYWADKSDAVDEAINDGWEEIDGKHYCPCCYDEDPQNEDNFIPKPPLPEYVHELRRFLTFANHHEGRMREEGDKVYVTFHNPHNKILDPAWKGMIDKILEDVDHTITRIDDVRYANCQYEICMTVKNFKVGDRVRCIRHNSYQDAFGKEGYVTVIFKEKRLCTVEIEDGEDVTPRCFSFEAFEMVKPR